MARHSPSQEAGIHGHRPRNNPNAWAANTGEHVTIRHIAAKLVSVAIRMMNPDIGNVLGVRTANRGLQMNTHTSTANAD